MLLLVVVTALLSPGAEAGNKKKKKKVKTSGSFGEAEAGVKGFGLGKESDEEFLQRLTGKQKQDTSTRGNADRVHEAIVRMTESWGVHGE